MARIGLAVLAESDVASAATCDIGATEQIRVRITGTTTITSFGSASNKLRFIRFAAALTLTHGANLSLPGAADITTAAGDTAIAVANASGVWIVTDYTRNANAMLTVTSAVSIGRGQFQGINSNTAASAGNIGEKVSASVAYGAATSLVDVTPKTVTSISLTAGNWLVTGMIGFKGTGTTILLDIIGCISQTNNGLSSQRDFVAEKYTNTAVFSAGADYVQHTVPTVFLSLNSTTTIYLVAYADFATSTLAAFGNIDAIRIN